MKTIQICAHTIEYWYDDDNHEMDESSQDHVKNCLIDNCVEGELCDYDNKTDSELRGWWKISTE